MNSQYINTNGRIECSSVCALRLHPIRIRKMMVQIISLSTIIMRGGVRTRSELRFRTQIIIKWLKFSTI